MFDDFAILAGALGLGAALAIPVTRRTLLGDPKIDFLAGELEFDHLNVDGCSVHLKSGEIFRVWEIEGLSYETKSLAKERTLCTLREKLFHHLSKNKTSLRLFGVKRNRDVSFEAVWPSRALSEIGQAEQAIYRKSFDVRWFMIQQAKTIAALEEVKDFILSTLAPYKVSLLYGATSGPSSLLNFLNYLLCGELRNDLRPRHHSISADLPACDLHANSKGLIQTFTPLERCHRVIAIKLWPDLVMTKVIGQIMALPFDIEIFQLAKYLSAADLVGLERKRQELGNSFLGNAEAREEYDAVLKEYKEDRSSLHETQFTITLRAQDTAALDRNSLALTAILADQGIAYCVETNKGALVCWFNRLPGQDTLYRPLRLMSHNLAAFWPFEHSPTGLEASACCPAPVRLFKTMTGQSYRFQFPCSAKPQSLGNFLVFAPSGSGKTTLVLHLLAGLSKNPAFRSFVFDSKQGARAMIEAFGGTYKSYESLSFNPLDVSESNQRTRQTITNTLRAMLGETYRQAMDDHIDLAVSQALDTKPEYRTFNQIYDVAFAAGSDLKKAFEKWVVTQKGKEGLYSHIFNAPRDDLKGFLAQSFLTGINMNEALEDPFLAAPVVYHITQAIEEMTEAGGHPFAVFIDEASNLLRNEAFRKNFVNVLYREIRKRDGFIGMAFQEPLALSAIPDASAVIGNTATFIFFPSSNYDPKGLEAFKLNQDQEDFILNRHPTEGARRVLVIKREDATGYEESVILSVDLADFGRALRFYGSGQAANRRLDALKKQWGAQWLEKL